MKQKKEKHRSGNFDADKKLKTFLNSFHSTLADLRVQCLNCDALTTAGRTVPTAIHERSTDTVYVFRICNECRSSFFNVGDELKKDFCESLMNKTKKAEARIK